LRVDQIANRLSLGQVEPAIKEGPHGKFTRLSQPRAARESQLDNMPQYDGRSMSGDFNDVVGCIRVRLPKVSDDNFVNALFVWRRRPFPRRQLIRRWHADKSVRATRFDKLCQHGAIWLQRLPESKHRHGNRPCLRSREPYDADAPSTRRRGNGNDSVVKVHERKSEMSRESIHRAN
jgi:hypothetical protein